MMYRGFFLQVLYGGFFNRGFELLGDLQRFF